MNALVDALAERGVTHIDMPATPERVWRALQEASPQRSSNMISDDRCSTLTRK